MKLVFFDKSLCYSTWKSMISIFKFFFLYDFLWNYKVIGYWKSGSMTGLMVISLFCNYSTFFGGELFLDYYY